MDHLPFAASCTADFTSNSASFAEHPSKPYAKDAVFSFLIQNPAAFCEFQVVDDEMSFVRHSWTLRAEHEADQVFRTTNSADRIDLPANVDVGIR